MRHLPAGMENPVISGMERPLAAYAPWLPDRSDCALNKEFTSFVLFCMALGDQREGLDFL